MVNSHSAVLSSCVQLMDAFTLVSGGVYYYCSCKEWSDLKRWVLTKEAHRHCQGSRAAESLARNQGFGPSIPCFPCQTARLSNTPPEMPAPDYEGLDWSESDQDEPEAAPSIKPQDQSKGPSIHLDRPLLSII